MLVGLSRKRLTRILLWAAPLTGLGCGGGSGTDIVLPSLTITTSTAGVELDTDGYGVAVDGSSPQAIGLDATVTIEQLPEGLHAVELSGMAANCTAASNPLSVTVTAAATATATFAITCGSSSGSVAVTTATSGAGSDADGFALTFDGVDRGLIGVNATASLAGLTAGVHSLGLTGLAANCVVAGDNPRNVTVVPGQATPVGFAITCVAPPAGSGSVQITTTTTGSAFDPNGYSVSLDGGGSQGIGTNGTLTIGSVRPGSHSVQLSGEAANCTISGGKTRAVPISSGQTTTVQFSIACVTPPPGSGSVQITTATTGSPLDPNGYSVSLDGGTPQDIGPNGTLTIGSVPAGSHSLQLSGAAANCTVAGDNPRSVTVLTGQTATVPFTITCAAPGSSVNFRVSNLYLTQSVQTLAGSIPLVAGRSAYLRVFVVANQSTGLKPTVRVTLRNGGTVTQRTITAPGGANPTSVQEGTLASSWNLPVEASLIQPGLSVLAEVDPLNAIAESNENDNTFPASGTPQALTVNTAPVANIRFVPIQQGQASPGNVSNSNKDQLVDLARRLYPLNAITTDVHPVYRVAAGQLQSDGTGWNQVLSDLDGMRVAEGSDRTYYGVAKLDYQFGIVGLGFVGVPTAMGTDDPADVRRVTAHELGHTWNQLHAPCGNPPASTIDPNFPYSTGTIGTYGFDVAAVSLKSPASTDLMGYCSDPWISDYTYNRVMAYRQAQPFGSRALSAKKQPTLLVWGRIVNGQPVLEPAFQVVTRPVLPARPGAYSVQGIAGDGTSLFSLSFDPAEAADDPRGSRHFAFAVPMDQARAAQLADVRLTGPGGLASAASLSVARLRAGVVPDSVVARREADGVAIEWNAAAHPMVMVRDPDTGEVLSFARGGKTQVWTSKRSLDLVTSDGVRSKAKRVAVTP